MPYTSESALTIAGVTQTALAASKARLFKSSFVPTVASLKAAFVAAECDYDGYTAGGVAITAFLGPFTNPTGGAAISSPLILFAWAHVDADVGNMVGGWWLETTAGKVWAYATFPESVPMGKSGDAIPLVIQLMEGVNPVG